MDLDEKGKLPKFSDAMILDKMSSPGTPAGEESNFFIHSTGANQRAYIAFALVQGLHCYAGLFLWQYVLSYEQVTIPAYCYDHQFRLTVSVFAALSATSLR